MLCRTEPKGAPSSTKGQVRADVFDQDLVTPGGPRKAVEKITECRSRALALGEPWKVTTTGMQDLRFCPNAELRTQFG